ncbi:hypothetical protein PCL_02778 [Purpureocillium lilacinum]|uniref:Uncharacterized protein n=1 Tax=Purpureocillium lilacinum TaxID=33203 RepID=A0A2U3E039_PURLI|nr:hypothetical protein PCL_02778 [Purpureocillium lilacinum]
MCQTSADLGTKCGGLLGGREDWIWQLALCPAVSEPDSKPPTPPRPTTYHHHHHRHDGSSSRSSNTFWFLARPGWLAGCVPRLPASTRLEADQKQNQQRVVARAPSPKVTYVFAAAAEGDGTPNKTGRNETDFEQSAVMPAGRGGGGPWTWTWRPEAQEMNLDAENATPFCSAATTGRKAKPSQAPGSLIAVSSKGVAGFVTSLEAVIAAAARPELDKGFARQTKRAPGDDNNNGYDSDDDDEQHTHLEAQRMDGAHTIPRLELTSRTRRA